MADLTRYYDLMLMLDPETPEGSRTQVIDSVKTQIGSGNGDLNGDADWGMRRLAYEIDHRAEAQYHLFQFRAEADLLEQLDRNLSIEDAVLRHRIIRLPGEPPKVTPRLEAPSRPPEPIASPPAAEGEAAEAPVEPPAGDAPAAEAPVVEAPAADAVPAEAAPAEEPPPAEEATAEAAPPAEPAAAEAAPPEAEEPPAETPEQSA